VPASSAHCPPHGAVLDRTGRRSLRATVAVVGVLAAAFVLAAPAAADPLASRQAQAVQILADIRELDASVSRAVDEYNGAQIRLDEIRSEQRQNRRHLAIARAGYVKAQRNLQLRLLEIYTSNNPSGLEVLLGASSLEDLLSRAEAVSRVSDQDNRVAREIAAFRAEMRRREGELRRAASEQQAVVAELASRRRAIEAQLAERQTMLASVRSEIERLEAAEREQERRLEAQARARVADGEVGGGSSGGSVSSGGGSEATSGGSAPPARFGGVVGIAMQYLGIPYRWGGSSPSTGFDCSGFVMYVYAQVGISLPHNAAMQYGYGSPVSRSDLQPGDIVFFNGLGHNGIYVGGGSFIHSPHTGDVVKISSLSSSWYASTYVGARRL
jgi:peptidoglycan DL-endopeptidase CwlO